MAAEIVDWYQSEVPAIVPDAPAVSEQVTSVEDSLRQVAHCIDTGDDPRRLDMTPSTVLIARSGVQRGIPLNDLFRSVRLAHEKTWHWMFNQITTSASTSEQSAALELATDYMFAYADRILVQAEHHYETEREAWLRGTAAARAAAVDDILAGTEADPQHASKRMRYDLNRHHLGATLWLDPARDEIEPQPALNEALSRLAVATSAHSALVHPAGSKATAAWLSRGQAFDPEELDIAHLSRALPDGVRLAEGEPGWGIGGFRRTHIEAGYAHRVASLLGERASAVTCYRDVAVAALASADGEHAVAFVKRILGPLAADDDATYRVAATLAVYLDENRSPARAAQRLTVHPNTVSYRVHQAEQLLGRPIDTNTLDLSVALALLPAIRGLADGGGAVAAAQPRR
ncbi:PucR family transcriptional regulator [Mycobacterium paragordonae]|uniref:Helix-turn-helix domain-containing protein n=1 Tax=Mycobacterium paragordonae TaxID=1389713 RepID=A0AAJ1S422_9MYCO|nr:helix-turn-helix domain-containing protein [Mycobacterium paragordonae]MDP7736087.1 helix-turn-helix domain-containing protein [Mycobacterium paragordonae]